MQAVCCQAVALHAVQLQYDAVHSCCCNSRVKRTNTPMAIAMRLYDDLCCCCCWLFQSSLLLQGLRVRVTVRQRLRLPKRL
jgi:hypothetical protein